jgi:UDP-N-acetylmuramate--alanine ligase
MPLKFDRSLLRLSPNISIVTSLDPDHLDIYGDGDEMKRSYLEFVELTDPEGHVLLHEAVEEQVGIRISRAFESYGLKTATIKGTNIKVAGAAFLFDYEGSVNLCGLELHLPGFHNVNNAVAAITVALHMGMDGSMIRERLSSYRGVKRRFEYILKRKDLVYIDDYAHHPSEIEALIESVRKLYPGKKLTVVFQPHLYSRTRDFQQGFAQSLSGADEVLLLDIYPAREVPIKGITSKVIFDKIESGRKQMLSLDDFPRILDEYTPEVLLTVGAGDIDTLVPKIKKHFEKSEEVEV